jgi:hypothetical protein
LAVQIERKGQRRALKPSNKVKLEQNNDQTLRIEVLEEELSLLREEIAMLKAENSSLKISLKQTNKKRKKFKASLPEDDSEDSHDEGVETELDETAMESPLLVKTGETDDTYNFNLEEGTKLFATNNEEENDFQGLSFDGESFSGDSDWFMKTLYNAEVGTGAMDVAALIDLEKTIDDYESSPLPFCHEEKPNTKEDQEEPNYTTFEDQEKESARSVLMGLIPTILHATMRLSRTINNNNNNNKLGLNCSAIHNNNNNNKTECVTLQ